MAKVNPFLSMIALNVNELRHKSGWMDNKARSKYMLSTRDFILKDTHRLKVEEWKNSIPCKY